MHALSHKSQNTLQKLYPSQSNESKNSQLRNIWKNIGSGLPAIDFGLRSTNKYLSQLFGNDQSYWTSAMHQDFPYCMYEGPNNLEKYKLCKIATVRSAICCDKKQAEDRLVKLCGPNGNDGLIHEAFINMKSLEDKKNEAYEKAKNYPNQISIENNGFSLNFSTELALKNLFNDLSTASKDFEQAKQDFEDLMHEMNQLAIFTHHGEIIGGRVHELRIELQNHTEKFSLDIPDNLFSKPLDENQDEVAALASSTLKCEEVVEKTFEQKKQENNCSIQ